MLTFSRFPSSYLNCRPITKGRPHRTNYVQSVVAVQLGTRACPIGMKDFGEYFLTALQKTAFAIANSS